MSICLERTENADPLKEMTGDAGQFLTFRSRGERFALPVETIREIIEFGSITRIPAMPGFIRGVINLRGNVVPVIDLASRFGQGHTEPGKRTCIVIMELEENEVSFVIGLIVDGVDSVLDFALSDIEPAPRFGAGIQADFIEGMVKIEGGFIVLLKVASVLSVHDMKALVAANRINSEDAPPLASATGS